jgi:class I fructose-bisphosphate aldolase
MKFTRKVKEILSYYESDNPGTKANIAKFLVSGKLGGTGRLVILPVDQGFEHGPERSFAVNPDAYDPHYHFKLAIDAGLSGYAAPLGMIESGADTFAGQIPMILKINSNNSLMSSQNNTNQAITSSVDDAIRLGCSAIGLTIYPGSDDSLTMFEDAREAIREAKSKGLASVVWSYPRGGDLTPEDETSSDVVSYAAHIACLLGAHIIKVKPPKSFISNKKAQDAMAKGGVSVRDLSERISFVKRSCFNGKRIVIFSGGESKDRESVLKEVQEVHLGGGNGSIIGRNTFQRPRQEALDLLSDIISIYKK